MADPLQFQVKKICEIVTERCDVLLEKELTIKWYEDLLRKVEKETEDAQRETHRVCAENEMFEKNLERLNFIMRSSEDSNDIISQTLAQYQIFEELLSKDLEEKHAETKRIKEEFQDIRNEAKRKITENPLYKEMEKARVEFLKVDIERRDLGAKLLIQKRINQQREEIQKRKFYNFFINMAHHYIMEKKLRTLEALKAEESRQIRRLFSLQQEAAMKKKMADRGDLSKLIFGSQESRSDKMQTIESEPSSSNKEPARVQTLSDQLNNIFNEELSMDKSPKVTAVQNEIMEPEFALPAFVVRTEKRKAKTIDLSKKWQKMLKRGPSRDSLNQSIGSDGSQLSQEPDSPMSQGNIQKTNVSQTTGLVQYSQSQQETTRPIEPTVQSHLGMMINSPSALIIGETIVNPPLKENLTADVQPLQLCMDNSTIMDNSFLTSAPSQPIRNISVAASKTTDPADHNLKRQQPIEAKGSTFTPSMFGNRGSIFGNEAVNDSGQPDQLESSGLLMGSAEGEQLDISDLIRHDAQSPEFTYQEPDLDNPRTPFTNIGGTGGFSFFSMSKFNPF